MQSVNYNYSPLIKKNLSYMIKIHELNHESYKVIAYKNVIDKLPNIITSWSDELESIAGETIRNRIKNMISTNSDLQEVKTYLDNVNSYEITVNLESEEETKNEESSNSEEAENEEAENEETESEEAETESEEAENEEAKNEETESEEAKNEETESEETESEEAENEEAKNEETESEETESEETESEEAESVKYINYLKNINILENHTFDLDMKNSHVKSILDSIRKLRSEYIKFV